MGIQTITTEIKTVLEGVDGIGLVHDYERWAASWGKLLDLFKTDDNIINGWIISRIRTEKKYVRHRVIEKAHQFKIAGMYGLKDESETEKTFQALLESIQTAFDSDSTLNSSVRTINPDWGGMAGYAGLQIDSVDCRQIGNILCHYAECRLGAIEIE